MITVRLPRLVGTRDLALRIVSSALTNQGASNEALIFARAVSSVTPSFLHGLVESLDEAGIRNIQVAGASDEFMLKLREVALRGVVTAEYLRPRVGHAVRTPQSYSLSARVDLEQQ